MRERCWRSFSASCQEGRRALVRRRCSPPPRTARPPHHLSGAHRRDPPYSSDRAPLPGLVEWKPSGIPSAAISRSQCFSQFQLSFSAKPRWVPVLPVRSRGSMPALGVDVDGQRKRIKARKDSRYIFLSHSYVHICGFNVRAHPPAEAGTSRCSGSGAARG